MAPPETHRRDGDPRRDRPRQGRRRLQPVLDRRDRDAREEAALRVVHSERVHRAAGTQRRRDRGQARRRGREVEYCGTPRRPAFDFPRRHRHRGPLADAQPRVDRQGGGHRHRGRGPGGDGEGVVDQARGGGDRRRHKPGARRDEKARVPFGRGRRVRGGERRGWAHHSCAGWRGPDDDHDAAAEHARGGQGGADALEEMK